MARFGDVVGPQETLTTKNTPHLDSVVIPPTLCNPPLNYRVVNVYRVGVIPEIEKSVPFTQWVQLLGPRGEVVRMRGVFDDGAMINAIDTRALRAVEARLSPLVPSGKSLRMANGLVVPSVGCWEGEVRVGGVTRRGVFEVFDSGGAWSLLFGKPLLAEFGIVRTYRPDIAYLSNGSSILRLANLSSPVPFPKDAQLSEAERLAALLAAAKGLDCEDGENLQTPTLGVRLSTSAGVSDVGSEVPGGFVEDVESVGDEGVVERDVAGVYDELEAADGEDCESGTDEEGTGWLGGGPMPLDPEVDWRSVWIVEEVVGGDDFGEPGAEQPILTKTFEPSILSRRTNPFLPARVDAVLAEVTIGLDLSVEEKHRVVALLREFADCFALSMSEVLPVEGAAHKLYLPEGATFRTKVNQRPLTPPQREFFNGVIDKMLAAEIIAPISHRDVKCCGATTLAKKAHEGGGLTLEELQHRVNEECVAAGFPSAFENLPPRPMRDCLGEELNKAHTPTKWRVCQDFADLNRVTQVPSLPQGDIRAKQQHLSGHRWLNVFDFASGFYACEVSKEDRPYVCFYVEGRGYFSYQRMPFGLTGAPSTFAELTARCLGDMVGTLIELFVDDGGMAADTFEEGMRDLRKFLVRVREKGLSLSAAKSEFFVTEAVFAGARVGPGGIKPDLSKLTAVVDWAQPADLQNLGSFLGLAGYFRSLIKGYSAIAQPLSDLARSIDLPKGKGRAAYQRAMKGSSLAGLWRHEHTKAFLRLKVALTREPVLRGPKFDGTPFVVTSDGCKFGFAGMLTQRHTTVLPSGKEVVNLHPVAFASKRTSTIEERYQPYILEFAALKFSLDKFSDMVYGFPIELETDCQALRDQLLGNKLNSTHARWRDGVLAHHIIDVRHRPGRLNPVADGLSRKYVNVPRAAGDGHEWSVSEDWEARTGLAHDVFAVGVGKEDENGDEVALMRRFKEERVFVEVLKALFDRDKGTELREKCRARHRAKGFMVEGGRLWKIADGKSIRARPRLECVTKEEAVALADEVHRNGGHFRRDNVKIELMDRVYSPGLDRSITKAILECGKCKAFGSTHLHSLLEPITRRHPFELFVSDSLSMPPGKGGYNKISLLLDTHSQHVWGDKLKTAPTGKSTCKLLGRVGDDFTNPEALMCDGGPEFDNREVRAFCEKRGIKLVITPAYSPWVNGLVEGLNKILLGCLKRLCAPDLGEDEYKRMEVPHDWPIHFDSAIQFINKRILPKLLFSPKEIVLGLVVNTLRTPVDEASKQPTEDDLNIHSAYVSQQHLDGVSQMEDHAHQRKAAFDKKVLARAPKEVIFKPGQLVQVYRSDLDYTFSTLRKLEPKWSAPRRVVSRMRNSYKLATLENLPIGGRFSSRRLRRFIPRTGTRLQQVQEAVEAALGMVDDGAESGGEGDTDETDADSEFVDVPDMEGVLAADEPVKRRMTAEKNVEEWEGIGDLFEQADGGGRKEGQDGSEDDEHEQPYNVDDGSRTSGTLGKEVDVPALAPQGPRRSMRIRNL